jgi:hypothetical protein
VTSQAEYECRGERWRCPRPPGRNTPGRSTPGRHIPGRPLGAPVGAPSPGAPSLPGGPLPGALPLPGARLSGALPLGALSLGALPLGAPSFGPLPRRPLPPGSGRMVPCMPIRLPAGPNKVGSPSHVSWSLSNPRGNPVTVLALSMIIPLTDLQAARPVANAITDGPRGTRAPADSQQIAAVPLPRPSRTGAPRGSNIPRTGGGPCDAVPLLNVTIQATPDPTQPRFIIIRYRSSRGLRPRRGEIKAEVAQERCLSWPQKAGPARWRRTPRAARRLVARTRHLRCRVRRASLIAGDQAAIRGLIPSNARPWADSVRDKWDITPSSTPQSQGWRFS